MTFDLAEFVRQIYRVSSNSFVIFASEIQCGQIAQMLKESEFKGTQRLLIWEKTNAAPLNAKTHYLRGLESAVWFKKKGAKVFNAFYKNTIFRYPAQPNQIHPTEKNHKLLAELILDNTNENDIVLDATAGSGSTALVALNLNRRFIAIEKHEPYAKKAYERLLKHYKEKYCNLLFFENIKPRYIES